MSKTLAQTVLECVARLRDTDLSEGCNVCEGVDADQVAKIADDLEFAARNETEDK